MNIAFRVDSSFEVGTGHITRCEQLAIGLQKNGHKIFFISRRCSGNINNLVKKKFELIQISHNLKLNTKSQEIDANKTIKKIRDLNIKLLIVDNYSIDEYWEKKVLPYCSKLMVIDDLANRKHYCDFILDQNFYHNLNKRYSNLVPISCKKLLGPKYALLRPSFFRERQKKIKYVKKNIKESRNKRFFIFFGGNDLDNLTQITLNVFNKQLLKDEFIDIVVGSKYKFLYSLMEVANARPRTKVYVQTNNIAKIMSKADYAICSGGVNTWERLCLNLESHVIINAENQRKHILGLEKKKLLRIIGNAYNINENKILRHIMGQIINQKKSKRKFLNICDGSGVYRTTKVLLNSIKND